MAERLKNGGRKEADSVEGRKDVTGWAEAWDRWWFAPELGHRLAAFRILFGVYLLGYFGSFIPKVVTVFSTQGVYSPWCAGDIALPPAGAVALYGLMMGVIAAFIFGCKTRWITPLLLLLYIYYWLLNLAVKDTAYDRLNLLFLFLSCWGELDAVWAVSPSRQRESGRESRVLPWAGRVLMLQLSLLYLGAGLWKVCGSAWEGEMLEWTLVGPWGTSLAFGFVQLGWSAWFWEVLTAGVVAVELILPMALFWRPLRLLAATAGILFHLSIALLLNVPEFLNCVAAYVLFWKPEEIQQAVSKAKAYVAPASLSSCPKVEERNPTRDTNAELSP